MQGGFDTIVLTTDKYAKLTCVGKVIVHLKTTHAKEIEDDEKKE